MPASSDYTCVKLLLIFLITLENQVCFACQQASSLSSKYFSGSNVLHSIILSSSLVVFVLTEGGDFPVCLPVWYIILVHISNNFGPQSCKVDYRHSLTNLGYKFIHSYHAKRRKYRVGPWTERCPKPVSTAAVGDTVS